MKKSLVDVPVLLIFFTRPEKTSEVFNRIKDARPSKLYLYQDGAREGRDDDIKNIMECRKIVEQIDWDCEVHKLYQTVNYGCDPSEYISQKWMFEKEEYGIILEDDDVPSISFFRYCKELLEKYKDNDKIQMICGYNPVDYYDAGNGADYFFSTVSSIWGWASWKRVIDTWDPTYSWMDDPKLMDKVLNGFQTKSERNSYKSALNRHRRSNKEHYETINASNMYLYDRLAINPVHNMISNIGVGENTTHSVNDINLLPKSIRKLLYKETYEYQFPIKHPDIIKKDIGYKAAVDKALGFRGYGKVKNRVERIYLILKYQLLRALIEKCKNLIKR